MISAQKSSPFVTVNPCRLCAPLGASLAFKGIQGAISLLHGSQGCSTYIRRYMISHFREPVDIASSNFSEETAIFGGWENISNAVTNLIRQYHPSVIGIATTCLTETIGDDPQMWIQKYTNENRSENLPQIIPVSTPSYNGSHEEGYHAAVAAIVKTCASEDTSETELLILPPMLTPEDLRKLNSICKAFGINVHLLPDYSETLDGGIWDTYRIIPPGGTPVSSLRGLKNTKSIIELGAGNDLRDAGCYLKKNFISPVVRMDLPVGVRATDCFMAFLSELTGRSIPEDITKNRLRLLDAFADGHKYVFEKRALCIGDEDTVAAVVSLLTEIGIEPVICATVSGAERLRAHIRKLNRGKDNPSIAILDEADFDSIEQLASRTKIDICIGTSKAYSITRKLGIPLVRIGFPIHDRFGASRLGFVGYEGTLNFFDRIINALIEKRQDTNETGYSYI
jgi:nitrogenase molybdenum-iron protein NifN